MWYFIFFNTRAQRIYPRHIFIHICIHLQNVFFLNTLCHILACILVECIFATPSTDIKIHMHNVFIIDMYLQIDIFIYTTWFLFLHHVIFCCVYRSGAFFATPSTDINIQIHNVYIIDMYWHIHMFVYTRVWYSTYIYSYTQCNLCFHTPCHILVCIQVGRIPATPSTAIRIHAYNANINIDLHTVIYVFIYTMRFLFYNTMSYFWVYIGRVHPCHSEHTYDRFCWKYYNPKIHQFGKLRFLGTNSNSIWLFKWTWNASYRGISVSRFDGFSG